MAHPYDPTATLPSNVLITNHSRKVPTAWIIRPKGGTFYTRDLIIYNNVGGGVMRPLLDYRILEIDSEATVATGKETGRVIVILDSSITDIKLQRRLVGGKYEPVGSDVDELIDPNEIDALNSSTWGQIYNLPKKFPPAPHLHPMESVFGVEQIHYMLDEIMQLIGSGSPFGYGAIIQYAEQLITAKAKELDERLEQIETIAGAAATGSRFTKNMIIITTDNVNPAETLKYGKWQRLPDTLLHSVANVADLGKTTRVGEGASYTMTGVAMWLMTGD